MKKQELIKPGVWVPVEHALPPVGECVFVVCAPRGKMGGQIDFAQVERYRTKGRKSEWVDSSHIEEVSGVKYWMRIPDFPEWPKHD